MSPGTRPSAASSATSGRVGSSLARPWPGIRNRRRTSTTSRPASPSARRTSRSLIVLMMPRRPGGTCGLRGMRSTRCASSAITPSADQRFMWLSTIRCPPGARRPRSARRIGTRFPGSRLSSRRKAVIRSNCRSPSSSGSPSSAPPTSAGRRSRCRHRPATGSPTPRRRAGARPSSTRRTSATASSPSA